MQSYERVSMGKKHIIINNFLGGIAWGLGATLGLAVLLAIIGFAISKVNLVPIIGNIISTSFEQALKNNPNIR